MLGATGKFIDFLDQSWLAFVDWAGSNLGEAMRKSFHDAVEFLKLALRGLLKKGDPRALALFALEGGVRVRVTKLQVDGSRKNQVSLSIHNLGYSFDCTI